MTHWVVNTSTLFRFNIKNTCVSKAITMRTVASMPSLCSFLYPHSTLPLTFYGKIILLATVHTVVPAGLLCLKVYLAGLVMNFCSVWHGTDASSVLFESTFHLIADFYFIISVHFVCFGSKADCISCLRIYLVAKVTARTKTFPYFLNLSNTMSKSNKMSYEAAISFKKLVFVKIWDLSKGIKRYLVIHWLTETRSVSNILDQM